MAVGPAGSAASVPAAAVVVPKAGAAVAFDDGARDDVIDGPGLG